MSSLSVIALRLGVALLLSGAIGLQRASIGKEAGLRTHIVVGVGAALFTMIAGAALGATAATASRVTAQIVVGIGFIAGGVIVTEHSLIRGLTTAATVWVVAALGMAAGAGMYGLGVVGALLVLVVLVALPTVEGRLPRRTRQAGVIQVTLSEGASVERLRAALDAHCHTQRLTGLTHDGDLRLTFAVEVQRPVDITAVSEDLRRAGAGAVIWHTVGLR